MGQGTDVVGGPTVGRGIHVGLVIAVAALGYDPIKQMHRNKLQPDRTLAGVEQIASRRIASRKRGQELNHQSLPPTF